MTSRAPDTGVGRRRRGCCCCCACASYGNYGSYVTCGHVISDARDFAIIALIPTTSASVTELSTCRQLSIWAQAAVSLNAGLYRVAREKVEHAACKFCIIFRSNYICSIVALSVQVKACFIRATLRWRGIIAMTRCLSVSPCLSVTSRSTVERDQRNELVFGTKTSSNLSCTGLLGCMQIPVSTKIRALSFVNLSQTLTLKNLPPPVDREKCYQPGSTRWTLRAW